MRFLAVNQAINEVPKQGKGDLKKIANGDNQLLLRVTALIDKKNGGVRSASPQFLLWLSLPLMIRACYLKRLFAIRDERGVTKFEKSPSIKVTSNGQDVEIMTDLIYDQSFSLIKDYDAMLQGYNQAGGKAAIATASVTKKTTGAKVISQPQLQAEGVTKNCPAKRFPFNDTGPASGVYLLGSKTYQRLIVDLHIGAKITRNFGTVLK
ncbi:DUF2057 family protein [Vibrio sinaloensis]|nr:DUF2057 family protein [Vibrio sinaloensis]